ncbi:MAG: AAA family ATPase [Deltaproteobacteria bacterium]|nr:AAA family ATPase [Deltaproteobacteria bacterium]
MKLHRIDTLNLNSLYGEQSVDLDTTLDGASLFLIHGPTGSGKSTLMDAVSLALFGETPRLHGTSGDVDTRAVMSRGTGECSASVVFSKLGSSGRQRYRAIWSCHRARKNADGRFQHSQRSLERLESDGSWKMLTSSKKRKDYLPAFDEVLEGFDVGDFNRSMLLAQGQFDAFLNANEEERASILERLTDTDLYATLGARVARMHAAYKRRVDDLRALLGRQGGLSPEGLEALEKQHAENERELTRAKQALTSAQTQLAWFERVAKLQAEIEEAKAQKSILAQRRLKAADELSRLAEHERCVERAAFTRLDASTSAADALTKHQQKLSELEQAQPTLQAAAKAAAARFGEAEGLAERVEAALAKLRPLADTALGDTAQQLQAQRGEEEARSELVQVRNSLEAKTLALREAQTRLKELERDALAAREDVARHGQDPAWKQLWPELRTRLDKLVERLSIHEQARAKRAAEERALEQKELSLSTRRGALEVDRERALAPARAGVAEAEKALGKLDARPDYEAAHAGLLRTRDEVVARLDRLQDARAPVAELAAEQKGVHALDRQLDQNAKQLVDADTRIESRRAELELAEQAEVEARRSLDDLKRVLDLVPLRVELVDGEECPLCGAEEHPFAHDAERGAKDAELTRTLAAAETRAAERRALSVAAQAAHAKATRRAHALRSTREVLTTQAQAAREKASVLLEVAVAALERCGLSQDTREEQLEEIVVTTRGLRDEANAKIQKLEAARERWQESRQTLRHAEEAQREVEAKLGAEASAQAERRRKHEADVQEARAMKAELDVEREACRGALMEHGFDLETDDPGAWRELGEQRLTAQAERERRLHDLDGKLANARVGDERDQALVVELQKQRERRATLLTERATAWEQAETRAQVSRQRFGAAWAEALALDPGWPEEQRPGVESEPKLALDALRERVQELRAGVESSRSQRQAAERSLHENRTKQKERRDILRSAERESQRARKSLDEVLAALGLGDAEALRERRLKDEDVKTTRAVRDDLDKRQGDVEAVLKERTRQRAEAQATEPEGFPEDPDAASLREAQEQAELASRHAAKAHQASRDGLRDHQRFHDEQAKNRSRLDELTQRAEVWATLHGLIGLNDGGSFKKFAQALNLGLLLDKANHHLGRLHERYRLVPRELEGVPTLEFDIEDLWQAGETMTPRSLSGGERFLVSLALALGLSDFRTVKMPIETLLLDEGFGTLDADTLSVALGALSQLQADGRQVGIISHVADLRERIEARIEAHPLGGGRSELRVSR